MTANESLLRITLGEGENRLRVGRADLDTDLNNRQLYIPQEIILNETKINITLFN